MAAPVIAPSPATPTASMAQVIAAQPVLWHPSVNCPVENSRHSAATIVCLNGEIDATTAPRLAELIENRINAAVTTVVIDLSAVEFLGVAGLSVLAGAAKYAEQEHIGFRLVIGPHCVDRALKAIGCFHHLSSYSNLEDALMF